MANSSKRIPIAPAVIAMALLSASCIRLDEDHCIVNGGDLACDQGRMCVTEIEEIREPSDRGDGCILIDGIDYDFDAYLVRVQYGLPEVMWPRIEPNENDVRSLGGVLVRAVQERGLGEVCVADEDVVLSFEPEWNEVDGVREFLDRPTRVRANTATLEPHHVEAIKDFDAAINVWLEECE